MPIRENLSRVGRAMIVVVDKMVMTSDIDSGND